MTEANGVTSWKVFLKLVRYQSYGIKIKTKKLLRMLYLQKKNLRQDDYFEKRDEAIKQHRRFFVTTAVNGKPVNIEFLNSIKNYCEKNNALLLILPSL